MGRLMEESRIPVRLDEPTPEDGDGEPDPGWVRLNFTMQDQSQTLWCWAATTVSVAAFYDPHSDWTQCAMVNAVKELTTCCEDGSSSACDEANVLDAPLSRADVLDHKHRGSVGYDVIRQETDAGRPLAFRVRWSGGGGHFAVIEGYRATATNSSPLMTPTPDTTLSISPFRR